jgi:hypothetical protein
VGEGVVWCGGMGDAEPEHTPMGAVLVEYDDSTADD